MLPTLAQTISQLGTVLSTVLTQLGKLLDGSEFVTKDMLSTIVSGIQGQSSSISQALIGFLSGLTSNIGNIFFKFDECLFDYSLHLFIFIQ